jgi:hypothetical protein
MVMTTMPEWAWIFGWMRDPHALAAVVGAVTVRILGIAARSRAECQRRETLVAMARDAPEGTVLVQARGLGGPAVMIIVGGNGRQSPAEPTR